jgi:NAD(P)-dependent dehydrogenase (short-subunit alcohol dehydrogenase family)
MTQVAWIAGVGATGGLGAALARRFARGGFRVALTGRDAKRLDGLAEEIRAGGGSAEPVSGDLTLVESVRRLGERVAALGEVKAAIFNAGNMFVRGAPLDLSPEDFEKMWRVGTFAGFLFTQQALKLLLAAGGGSLLYTGATASLRGRGMTTAFASSKAALRSLAQSVAREYSKQDIHAAHIVIDGGIDGEQIRGLFPQMAAQAGEDGLLQPTAIAEAYWQVHAQHRSAWTHELDIRPFKEAF